MSGLSEKDKAEILAEHWERRAKRAAAAAAAEAARPKPAVVAVVSEKFAEAAKANPESVRVIREGSRRYDHDGAAAPY